jgi:hypothetical protein
MKATGVDVLISAPQKGWSGPPCAGLVMLSERGCAAVEASTSTSMILDLKMWLKVCVCVCTGYADVRGRWTHVLRHHADRRAADFP